MFRLSVLASSLLAMPAFAEAPGGPAGLGPLMPLLLCFIIIYFLVVRPQQRKAKEQQKFVTDLKRGDMVITNGGIVGVVKALSDKIITLEIDEGVCLKILRSQILESATTLTKEPKPA